MAWVSSYRKVTNRESRVRCLIHSSQSCVFLPLCLLLVKTVFPQSFRVRKCFRAVFCNAVLTVVRMKYQSVAKMNEPPHFSTSDQRSDSKILRMTGWFSSQMIAEEYKQNLWMSSWASDPSRDRWWSGGRDPEFPPDMFLNSGGDQDNLGFIKNALMTFSTNSAIKSLSSHSSRVSIIMTGMNLLVVGERLVSFLNRWIIDLLRDARMGSTTSFWNWCWLVIWIVFNSLLNKRFRSCNRNRKLIGGRRNETSDGATISCSSQEEETSNESSPSSALFGNCLRYCRFAILSWLFQPTNRVVTVFFDPSIYLPNSILTSALKTLGYRSFTSVRGIDSRCKYLVDIWGCYQHVGLFKIIRNHVISHQVCKLLIKSPLRISTPVNMGATGIFENHRWGREVTGDWGD